MYIGHAQRKGLNKKTFKYSKKKSSPYHITYVIHATNDIKREKIAKCMEYAIAKKKLIKYSNSGAKSYSLYTALKKKKFDPRKLKKKAYTNCCNLVSVCCRFAGYKTPKQMSSVKLHKQFKKIKGFKVKKYKPGMVLVRGDIIVSTTTPGAHSMVVL